MIPIWVNIFMLLIEFGKDLPAGYGTESDDGSALTITDTRKTRLTLTQINRIRMINDVRKFEKEQELKSVSTQYAPPAEAGAPALI